jgi:hypothetical protein
MVHGITRDPRRIAITLIDFARIAAESRVIAFSGSVSTAVPLKKADSLTIRMHDRRIVLIGGGEDIAYDETDHQGEIEAMIGSGRSMIDADGLLFPIDGPAAASRPNAETLVLEAEHRRADGTPSGSIGRLVLIVDRSAGIITPEHVASRMIVEG